MRGNGSHCEMEVGIRIARKDLPADYCSQKGGSLFRDHNNRRSHEGDPECMRCAVFGGIRTWGLGFRV